MMGGTVTGDSGLAAFAALLQASADPNTRANWLAKVTAETVAAQQLHEKTKQLNAEIDAKQAILDAQHKVVDEKLANTKKLEQNIAEREKKHALDLDNLKAKNEKLAQDHAALAERLTQADMDINKRYALLSKSESDHKDFVEGEKQNLVARQNELERSFTDRLAQADRLNQEADRRHQEAVKEHVTALELKATHEKKLAALSDFLRTV